MRKLIIFLCLLSYTLFSCNRTTQNASNSESTEADADAPEMKFEEIQHDFGNLNEGDIVKYPFKFKNVGKAPLLIHSVNVGCGCTVASKPEKPIAVGESSQIVVQFNSQGKAGPQHKEVVILSNALPKQKILAFTALVKSKQ